MSTSHVVQKSGTLKLVIEKLWVVFTLRREKIWLCNFMLSMTCQIEAMSIYLCEEVFLFLKGHFLYLCFTSWYRNWVRFFSRASLQTRIRADGHFRESYFSNWHCIFTYDTHSMDRSDCHLMHTFNYLKFDTGWTNEHAVVLLKFFVVSHMLWPFNLFRKDFFLSFIAFIL